MSFCRFCYGFVIVESWVLMDTFSFKGLEAEGVWEIYISYSYIVYKQWKPAGFNSLCIIPKIRKVQTFTIMMLHIFKRIVSITILKT